MTVHNSRVASAVAVVGTAAGGGLALLAAGRVWAVATVTPVGGASQHLQATGRQAESGLAACAVACLALAVALLASSGWLRRLVGLTAVMASAATVATAVAARNRAGSAVSSHAFGVQASAVHPHTNSWWLLAVVGGLIALVSAGVAVAGRGRDRALGTKYDAPEAKPRPAATGPDAVWDDLDRGHDPTAEKAES